MNLYFRLFWTFLRAWHLPNLRISDTLERQLTVLPNDLDINGHMNNGRYLTIVDLALLEYFARIGAVKQIVKNGWRPMSGGAFITYRRALMPFARYTLRFKRSASNDHWNFMRFEFVRSGKVCAAGYFKGAMVGKDGFVSNQTVYASIGLSLEQTPLPPELENWLSAEEGLMQRPWDD